MTTGDTAYTGESSAAGWATMPCLFDDGPAPRAAIGLITLSTDNVIEAEVLSFLPKVGVALYRSRIPVAARNTPEGLAAMAPHIGTVAELLLPDDRLDVVAFGCTSGSMVIGPDGVAAAIHAVRPGVPVSNPVSAALDGLRALGARRIALLTPYPDRTNAVVGDYVAGQGFEIVAKGSFKQSGGPFIARIPPEDIYEAGVALGGNEVDALFVSCTALRVSSVLERIEDRIGKPVVASNQALAWDCLRRAGIDDAVPNAGRLFAL